MNKQSLNKQSSDKQNFDKQRFFFDHYGVTETDLEHYLSAALSAGGDYADLYFEYLSSTSLMVDESHGEIRVAGHFRGMRRARRFR